MLERGVRIAEVEAVIGLGDAIETYPDDTPFPSRLLLGFPGGRALHVVVADEPGTDLTYVITVYYPSLNAWDAAFRTRIR
jgi:hypothetical protein